MSYNKILCVICNRWYDDEDIILKYLFKGVCAYCWVRSDRASLYNNLVTSDFKYNKAM